ncbi:serine palmitoyltransferase component [Lathyrus oleraceus]|uniref:serine C-palmitoyltransferase n=1 Tax=Pisum sativum TaxID=3888 RepID=A0A9D4ZXQ4_PEA|nr:serine palmitoyltransferase component [Pisum sativum]KAI5386105.1 serine palmitoyltransferase component [Pisum sativum]
MRVDLRGRSQDQSLSQSPNSIECHDIVGVDSEKRKTSMVMTLDSCSSALEKYGVGSCGPRGFYGTIGSSFIHKFIPFNRDEGVHWGIQNGLYLSRSTVVYFKHNDMDSLSKTLENITSKYKGTKNLRRYIVVEALYQNSGQIAPLDEIIKLKEKYRFRILLDEGNSFGVLGSSGRGLTEHYGVPVEKLDLITAAMGHALATEGGFCTGSARVIDHQRLSSSGYVFSASLPPYLASAAITAIDVLDENPNLLTKLKNNIAVLWKGLSRIPSFTIASHPESPIVYLRLKQSTGSLKDDLQLLENIAERTLKEDSVFVAASRRSTLDKCKLPVGIRLFVSAGHEESDLHKASESLERVAAIVLGGRN